VGKFKDVSETIEIVKRLVERDGRYKGEAYLFVRDAFVRAATKSGKKGSLSGGDLLQGIRELGLERYGPTARLVFEHWGVKTTEDFGRVVFNMVSVGLMNKAEEDTIEDFKDVFDFQDEFEKKFKFRIDEDAI
jgi:uncharacterized repeat protein (TIGR04138 family)